MRTARATLGPTPRKRWATPSSLTMRRTPSKLQAPGERSAPVSESPHPDRNSPVLVLELLRLGLISIARHPHEHHISRVSRNASQSSCNRSSNGHLPSGQSLTWHLHPLLEGIVDAETGETVGHLTEDGGGETGVGAAAESWEMRGRLANEGSGRWRAYHHA